LGRNDHWGNRGRGNTSTARSRSTSGRGKDVQKRDLSFITHVRGDRRGGATKRYPQRGNRVKELISAKSRENEKKEKKKGWQPVRIEPEVRWGVTTEKKLQPC